MIFLAGCGEESITHSSNAQAWQKHVEDAVAVQTSPNTSGKEDLKAKTSMIGSGESLGLERLEAVLDQLEERVSQLESAQQKRNDRVHTPTTLSRSSVPPKVDGYRDITVGEIDAYGIELQKEKCQMACAFTEILRMDRAQRKYAKDSVRFSITDTTNRRFSACYASKPKLGMDLVNTKKGTLMRLLGKVRVFYINIGHTELTYIFEVDEIVLNDD